MEEVAATSDGYTFDETWRTAMRVSMGELQETFQVTSGELLWGHLRCMVTGMKATQRDVIPSAMKQSVEGGTIYQATWHHRAAAKTGEWKVARVQRLYMGITAEGIQTGWLLYHTSADPQELIELSKAVYFRSVHPRVAWVNRYDWSTHGIDASNEHRTLADLDPEEWRDAWIRKRDVLSEGHYFSKEGDPEWEKWCRLDLYNHSCAFFCDAERQRAPGLLKLLARPSELDTRAEALQSSSLYSPGQTEPFGIHLNLPYMREYEIARLIYGEEKSEKFSGDDELIGIWYDGIHSDGDRDATALPL